jgi:hypothetical protein
MRSRRRSSRDDDSLARRRDLLLRGVGEISTHSGIAWFRELAHAWLPDVSPETAIVIRAIDTRAAVICDAEAARPLLDFNWVPNPGPMDRIIDRLQQRGPRLVRDDDSAVERAAPAVDRSSRVT